MTLAGLCGIAPAPEIAEPAMLPPKSSSISAFISRIAASVCS
eukprot:CAMPEP_0182831288 /NCGR_PEP_ID=MMETSP0006_2-20121128/19043_1 /TAXON_ID=97485 /ORGANISM="Prymnesium parvum, Strain Texoma1" /LENGTH=41 /DNA_ID= /DNA_START= /DNA_END= /DNA_ORIENTATION=